MRSTVACTVAAALAALGACGSEPERLPAACANGAAAVRAALRAAPAAVRLDGVRLSDCLSRGGRDAAEVRTVGSAYVEAAAPLARAAARRPEGRAALELGYLVGASRSGASSEVGVHTELLRRLDQELAGVDTAATAFRRGELAGRRSG